MDVKPSHHISTPTATTQLEAAPPKQVATAMESLSDASRLISDIRMGADRLLEALITSATPHHADKSIEFFQKEDSIMRHNLISLRSIGKRLEESGVLNESMKSRSNSWGLHLPVVCPDGAAVAYAWKRKLAGQAGASAVDRTRLALKAFGDLKRKFFPHLDDDQINNTGSKRQRSPQELSHLIDDDLEKCKTLEKVIEDVKREAPTVKILIHERLGWLRRSSVLSGDDNEEVNTEHSFSSFGKPKASMAVGSYKDKISVVEIVAPSLFRCVISLHPSGSIDPDAVALFSPDECGSHVHARGSSPHHVFRHMTEHSGAALQLFLGAKKEAVLYTLMHWICGYEKVFSEVCCKCNKLLRMDSKLSLILPPVCRSYRHFSPSKPSFPYHIGCFDES